MRQGDAFAERYLSGRELWGDDFTHEQIESWFDDEREAYADLSTSPSPTEYGYHGINRFNGFRKLPNCRFSHALGIGSSFGTEFLPLVDRIDRITILEPSKKLRSKSLLGLPLNYVDPASSGHIPFAGSTFDLAVCFGVLHHIPNVTHVVSELGRVLAPGGWMVIREPVVSMGDWRYPRKGGLTKRERGIPRSHLERAINKAGLSIRSSTFCMSPLTGRLGKVVGRNLYATEFGAAVDRTLALATAWNYRYHAVSGWQKLRPSSVFIVAQRARIRHGSAMRESG
ncbi:class I SAM-dependent methyltransferase [Streptomyces sp. HUAS ZL42]|uniref:class I SAM-dependent methyltransferase n=1 Tax=Streptomyces sp. HUAS ZL42 TaxID=3231715 RepID=UPI00345ECAE3